ncbi:hypothetical protein [Yinghuangia seranimata]|uniref:hypothetical protein n=1 Tax=Yinghuangia seranimata TaxID=408067 RepID=UPI00248BF30A|nr:hypothetical protein [Yinghuangia seranimata]MDI2126732.1 hypothetical protein [Yinghuangia seranimata]
MPLIRRRVAALSVLPLLVVLSACGTNAGARDAVDAAKSAVPTGSSPAPSGNGSPGGTKAPTGKAAPLTRAQLKEALVPRSAMPEGWLVQVDPNGSGGSGRDKADTSDKPECRAIGEMLSPGKTSFGSTAETSMIAIDSAGGGKAYAISGVNLASLTPDDVRSLFARTERLLPGCALIHDSLDGTPGSVEYVRQEAPALGDAAVAYAAVTHVGAKAWVHGVVAVQVGSTVVESTYVNLSSDEIHMPDESLVRQQVERVQAVTAGRAPGA